MGGKFEESIYQMLSREPVTPNEVAKKLEISHKTALRALMHIALHASLIQTLIEFERLGMKISWQF